MPVDVKGKLLNLAARNGLSTARELLDIAELLLQEKGISTAKDTATLNMGEKHERKAER